MGGGTDDTAAGEIRARLSESIECGKRVLESECVGQAAKTAALVAASLRTGHRAIFFGNGGSAADAQHLAAELIGRLGRERSPLAALSLPTSLSAATAIANDYGYSEVLARELRAHARAGDIAIGLTTSGNSVNVLEALIVARRLGLTTVVLTGQDGGKAHKLADICIRIPTGNTQRVQEMSMHLGHTICEIVERKMIG